MSLRECAVEIFRAGVDAADPRRAVESRLRLDGDVLVVGAQEGEVRIPLPSEGRVLVVGAGKGSAPMVQALEQLLGDRVDGGVVCVKDGHGCPLEKVTVREASHPVPDQRGVEAAGEILALLEGAGEEDLVFSALSGGGSALLTLPAESVSLDDLQRLTDLLLGCGATIGEINTLRKHLSRVKGGRLALVAHPARVVNLVLSDVVGDRLDVIASGPFSADPSTFADAKEVLVRYGLLERVPEPVLAAIERGLSGEIPETPKEGDPALAGVTHAVVGSNRLSLEASSKRAAELGFTTLVLGSMIEGEAREVARVLAGIAKSCRQHRVPLAPPACVLAGGETTVNLRGKGLGGRNQELALALALELRGCRGMAGLSGGTDGTDGPTDAAGAVVTEHTVERAGKLNREAAEYLRENDSYHFFEPLGDLVKTGPTRTNVMDLQVLLVAE